MTSSSSSNHQHPPPPPPSTSTSTTKLPLILSIQSFCVHSIVGQKAAVFPLNTLGYEVDVINTVHLSNHKGYTQGATGSSLSASEFQLIMDGLQRNGIVNAYTHILTGYVGSVELLLAIAKILDVLDPNVIFMCDPVLGDHGKFYVPPELVDIYVKHLIPRATVLTPNQFEAEVLTGIKITCEKDAFDACDRLHGMGVPLVIITSCNLKESPTGHATLIASSWTPSSSSSLIINGTSATTPHSNTTTTNSFLNKRLRSDSTTSTDGQKQKRFALDFLLVPGRYVGTGDLTAALLLGWLISNPNDLIGALEKVCWTVRSVIQKTKLSSERGENPFGELKLISCLDDIRNPKHMGPVREC
jgi:pyridoxine kinase